MTRTDPPDAPHQLVVGKRGAVRIKTGKLPELQGGPDHHEAMAGVPPRHRRLAFGLRMDFAFNVIPDGFVRKGKTVGLMAKGPVDWPGRCMVDAEKGLEE